MDVTKNALRTGRLQNFAASIETYLFPMLPGDNLAVDFKRR